MHQVRALRQSAFWMMIAALLLGVSVGSPVVLAVEPTPAPTEMRQEESMAGPMIGLSLAIASSALAAGIAFGVRRRIDEIGAEGVSRERE
ncbi:MAG: hypothetical protein ACUVSY_05905 [Roseiflexus sp.]